MPYTTEAEARRRCTATCKNGRPCLGWALWNHPEQVCATHSGRPRRTEYKTESFEQRWQRSLAQGKTHYPPCRCSAYAWPHRPGSGLCLWPARPIDICPTPAGTRAGGYRYRRRCRRW